MATSIVSILFNKNPQQVPQADAEALCMAYARLPLRKARSFLATRLVQELARLSGELQETIKGIAERLDIQDRSSVVISCMARIISGDALDESIPIGTNLMIR